MEKRILIFYITNLSGHHKAAEAIEKSLKILDPRCQIFSLDALTHLHSYSSRLVNFLYSLVIRKASFIWAGIYDKNAVIRFLNPLKHLIHLSNLGKVERLMRQIKPQAVVCTQAFPCGVIASYKSRRDGNFSLFGVVTDFWPHGFWFYDEVSYYSVVSDWCQHRFQEAAIPQERVKTLGIPVMPEFEEKLARQDIASQLDLRLDLPGVLLMGGGSGLGPLKDIALALDKSSMDFQIMVVCGKNKNLYQWFCKQEFNKPFKIFAYTEDVHKLMSFSDIIITKPGGITISESLSKGLAIIALNPIPGQEANNLRFLSKEQLAFEASTFKEVVGLVERLLRNRDELESIKTRGRAFGKPNSAEAIAKLILDSIP